MLVGENITRLFCFQGPCKWLPIEKSVTSIICGMILHGCGLGASLVGGFSDAHKSAVGLNSVIATLQLSEKHSNFRSWVGCPTPSTPMALCPVSGPLSLPWEHLLVRKIMLKYRVVPSEKQKGQSLNISRSCSWRFPLRRDYFQMGYLYGKSHIESQARFRIHID